MRFVPAFPALCLWEDSWEPCPASLPPPLALVKVLFLWGRTRGKSWGGCQRKEKRKVQAWSFPENRVAEALVLGTGNWELVPQAV